MVFWIFMLIMLMVIPLIMICFGKHFIKTTSKEINILCGYRTKMSMKNLDTWQFSQKYCGKICYNWGRVLLPITVLPMLFLIGQTEDTISLFSLIPTAIQVLALVASIYPVEKALKREFDKNGNKKNILD